MKNKGTNILMKELKLIVAGSRTWEDYDSLKKNLNEILADLYLEYPFDVVTIVSGTTRGADQLGERFAEEYNYLVQKFPADWDKEGKRAGILRNIEMAKYSHACVVFWDGKSKGTRHMIDIAKQHNLALYVVQPKEVYDANL